MSTSAAYSPIGTPAPRRPRKIRIIRSRVIALIAVLITIAVAYTVYALNAPLPDLHTTPVANAETSFSGATAAAAEVVESRTLPTAIGWLEDEQIWSNNDEPQQLASVTKLIAALVCQDARPLPSGEEGPTYSLTAADQQVTAEIVAENGIVHPFPLGFELSARDMLRLSLIPSSNNITISYVNWVFGDNDAFVAATKKWATDHGFDSLTVVEPSGLSELNTASVSDLIRIAKLALADPTIAETVRMAEVEVPFYGTITNTNPLITETGMLGIKTGSTTFAGYNLLAGKETVHGNRTMSVLSATLGRESLEERADDSRSVLDEAAATVASVETLQAGEVVAHAVTWEGETIRLVARQNSSAVLAPGETAHRTLTLNPLQPSNPRSMAGTVQIDSPHQQEVIDVITADPISEPSIFWRLTHPLRR